MSHTTPPPPNSTGSAASAVEAPALPVRRISQHLGLGRLDGVSLWIDAEPGKDNGAAISLPSSSVSVSQWACTLDAIEQRHREALPALRGAFAEFSFHETWWARADVLGRLSGYCVLVCTLDDLLEGTRTQMRTFLAELSGAPAPTAPGALPEYGSDRLPTTTALWRNKVFAHVAWSSPHRSENEATRATTLQAPSTCGWNAKFDDVMIGGVNVVLGEQEPSPPMPPLIFRQAAEEAEALFARWATEISWYAQQIRLVPMNIARANVPRLSARSWMGPDGVKYIERAGESVRPM